MSKGLIYIADDEKNIRELLQQFLERENYTVKTFENGDDLLLENKNKEANLIILDVMMPGTDGFSVCAELRKNTDIPIILLTARGTDADYITGFTLGCDDYFTKPFSPVKLTMRVNAIFKRLNVDNSKQEDALSFGDIKLMPSKKIAYCKGEELKLTNTEYKLLYFLIKENERAVSRDELLTEIWGYASGVETRATDDTVKRLRKKLKDSESSVIIDTVWGYGFKLKVSENDK